MLKRPSNSTLPRERNKHIVSTPTAMAYMERRTRRCANHLIAARQDQETYLKHVSALGEVDARIDNGPPPRAPHLYRNRKKETMKEERNYEIERENIILLNRMQDILRKPTDKKRSTEPFSMNIGYRRRQLSRITQENRVRWCTN